MSLMPVFQVPEYREMPVTPKAPKFNLSTPHGRDMHRAWIRKQRKATASEAILRRAEDAILER